MNTSALPGLPLVAVVILNWNGEAYLKKFLPSVLASAYANREVIVADNCSTDGSLMMLAENFPEVKIIKNKSNGGFAKGYNEALAKIDADYFVLLNSDVEVSPNWIMPIINLMEKEKQIGACQPKVLSYHHKEYFEYAGAAGGWIDNWGYPFCRGRVFDECEKDEGQYDDTQPCFWATGAALFVRAHLYKELDGLDENFFAHQEEIDFCWRLQLAGYSVYAVPEAVVYHVGGGTLAKTSPKKTYLNFRNNLIMLSKNLPKPVVFIKIPLRLFLDVVAAWRFLFAGELNNFMAVAKAHVHYLSWLFLEQKPPVFKANKKAKLQGVYKGCLVWDYFIKRKNTFLKIITSK